MAESGRRSATWERSLGRWTWKILPGYFPKHPENPFSAYLATSQVRRLRTLREFLGRSNSTCSLGRGENGLALKEEEPKDLVIFGSAILIQGLLQAGVLDRLVLLVHPLVLGSGRKLFAESGGLASLRLKEAKTTARVW
jgi:dihydrofolate reductase